MKGILIQQNQEDGNFTVTEILFCQFNCSTSLFYITIIDHFYEIPAQTAFDSYHKPLFKAEENNIYYYKL